MSAISRRALLGASGLSLASLAGCGILSSNTTNGVTTVEVDVAALENYGTAALNAANFILPLLGATLPGVAAFTAILTPIITTLNAQLTTFKNETAGLSKIALTITTTSIKSTVESLIAAVESLYTTFATFISSLVGQTISTQIGTYMSAFETITSEVEALYTKITATFTTSATMRAEMPRFRATMPVPDALNVLHAG